jgi:hypothetical protein
MKKGPGLPARSLTNIGISMSKCFGEGRGGWTRFFFVHNNVKNADERIEPPLNRLRGLKEEPLLGKEGTLLITRYISLT